MFQESDCDVNRDLYRHVTHGPKPNDDDADERPIPYSAPGVREAMVELDAAREAYRAIRRVSELPSPEQEAARVRYAAALEAFHKAVAKAEREALEWDERPLESGPPLTETEAKETRQ